MMTTDISVLGLCVGLLLMALPIYFFHLFRVPLIKSTVIATVRMVVQLLIIGLYLKYLFLWNNPFINILWTLIMVVVAAFTATSRTKLKRRFLLMPIGTGFLVSALVVGLYFLVFVLGLDKPFDARYFIPIIGILLGNMLGVNVLSLSTYYQGLQRERQLYYYLLGNGATHLEAVTPFISKAIEKSFMPCIANMAVMGIVSLPGTMIGQILGGSNPDVAVKYQIMIIVITFCASMLSLVITLWLARKLSFDDYGRLRDITRKK
jgi:putative ABC transport system permease protein